MGDRHGGRFARRGRTLNPPHPQVDAHRGVGFRCNGAVGRIYPRAGTLPTAKASRHGARAKEFASRRNTPLGEGLPTRRTSERICPAREHAPRRRPPDTAHERKGFAPRENALLGEGLPTRREGERICAAQEHAPRRRPPDTAHVRRAWGRAGASPPHVPTNGGPPSVDGQPKNTPSAGSHPQRAAAAEFIHLKK